MGNPTIDVILPIPIEQIRPSVHQARRHFSDEALQALAESMKHEGLIQPITVRRVAAPRFSPNAGGIGSSQFELVSGERRLRAAHMLGWTTIQARIIATVSEGEAAAKGLIENLLREDLSPLEEAQGFSRLHQADPSYWSQRKIAEVVGKTEGYISQSMALLGLPVTIRENFSRLKLTRSHALELLRLRDPASQETVSETIAAQGLTREKTRQLVDRILGKEARGVGLASGFPGAQGERGLGGSDPLNDFWLAISKGPANSNGLKWRAHYRGNWVWQFTLNLSAFWAKTQRAVSIEHPQTKEKRQKDLRVALADWFELLAKRLRPATLRREDLTAQESLKRGA